jgi:GT2 family glycosyltransferase
MRAPDLSIIIVNWNSAEFLRPCLKSIFANPTPFTFEVLVVDNASYDGSAAMVGVEFPQVKFIQSGTNLGFAAASNLAFSHSQGRNILFLNPDTKIVGDALGSMLEVLVSAPRTGLVGPRLVNPDGSTQVSCLRVFPTLLNQSFDADILRRRFSRPLFWRVQGSPGNAGRLLTTEVVPGACVMVRRELFEQLGGFRESYFMYGEDVDLSYEAKRAGFQNYCVKDAVVVHYGGESSRQCGAAFAPVLMRQSMADFLRAKRGRACAAAYRALTAVVAISRVLIIALLLIVSRNRAESRQRVSTLSKWAKILRWTLGLEPWTSRPTSQASSEASFRQLT